MGIGPSSEANNTSAQASEPVDVAEALRVAGIVHRAEPSEFDALVGADHALTCTAVPVAGVQGAFIIENVLSREECAMFIAVTERFGYTIAPLTTAGGAVLDPESRNNKRVMMELETVMRDRLAARVRALLPPVMDGRWALMGDDASPGALLNERLRFYRYQPGQQFAPHFDGCFPRSETESSWLTFICYLSEGFEGGKTTFFPEGRTGFSSPAGSVEPVCVTPRIGSALLFPHRGEYSPFHEGSPHVGGTYKYVLRSDIMYKLQPDRK